MGNNNELSNYVLQVNDEIVIVKGKNIADVCDILETQGIKNYKFIYVASIRNFN